MSCADYLSQGLCTGYGFATGNPDMAQYMGQPNNYPENNCCACGYAPNGAWEMPCIDAPAWSNGDGVDCHGYRERNWCYGNTVMNGMYDTPEYRNPSTNCCACGGGCRDTMGWRSSDGMDCKELFDQGYCNGAAVSA